MADGDYTASNFAYATPDNFISSNLNFITIRGNPGVPASCKFACSGYCIVHNTYNLAEGCLTFTGFTFNDNGGSPAGVVTGAGTCIELTSVVLNGFDQGVIIQEGYAYLVSVTVTNYQTNALYITRGSYIQLQGTNSFTSNNAASATAIETNLNSIISFQPATVTISQCDVGILCNSGAWIINPVGYVVWGTGVTTQYSCSNIFT